MILIVVVYCLVALGIFRSTIREVDKLKPARGLEEGVATFTCLLLAAVWPLTFLAVGIRALRR